jgi:hypothetical protein
VSILGIEPATGSTAATPTGLPTELGSILDTVARQKKSRISWDAPFIMIFKQKKMNMSSFR